MNNGRPATIDFEIRDITGQCEQLTVAIDKLETTTIQLSCKFSRDESIHQFQLQRIATNKAMNNSKAKIPALR